MKSDLPRPSKRGQRNLSVSCLASWAAFDDTGRDWLNWLLRWLPSFSYQSAIKKITSWFNGPGLLSAPSRQKPCTFPGFREEHYVRTICCLTLTLCSQIVTAKLQSQRVNGPNVISRSNNNLVNEIHWWPQSKNNRCISSLFFPYTSIKWKM